MSAALAPCAAAKAVTSAAIATMSFFMSSPLFGVACRQRRRHHNRLGSARSVTPLAKLCEERVSRCRIDVVLAKRSRECDRLLELREVLAAVRACADVSLEAGAIVARECALEVVGHELDELPTRQTLLFTPHVGTPLPHSALSFGRDAAAPFDWS